MNPHPERAEGWDLRAEVGFALQLPCNSVLSASPRPSVDSNACLLRDFIRLTALRWESLSEAEFWYIDRLPGEPEEGVADRHIHPLEPISARFTLSKLF